MTDFIAELRAKMSSHSGVVYLAEEDELRLETKCHQAAVQEGYGCFRWTYTDGLQPVSRDIVQRLRDNNQDVEQQLLRWRGIVDPAELLRMIKVWELGPSVVLAYDLFTLANRLPSLPIVMRLVKDITEDQQQERAEDAQNPDAGICQLVLCDRETSQLETPLQRMRLELPDRAEMAQILDAILEAVDESIATTAKQNRDRILNALAGLPAYQAANAISESIVRLGTVDASLLKEYKKELVAAKGLTWIECDERGFDAIGGLTPLKDWLKMVFPAFNPEIAAEYNLEPPKGVAIAGAPGCGKSALVKALGKVWDLPVLRLDIGQTRGVFQSESERGFEQAIASATACAPCILHIDELEKGFEGAASSGETDGGTGARVLQSFLTWLQERPASKPVFIYATMNRPERVVPEMLRAGRFDANFWVDFPGEAERRGILDVYCQRYDKAVDIDKEVLLRASTNCSGAEIESAWRTAALQAMADKHSMTTDDVKKALETVTRAKHTFKVEGDLKAWKEAAMPANDPEDQAQVTEPVPRTRRIGRTN